MVLGLLFRLWLCCFPTVLRRQATGLPVSKRQYLLPEKPAVSVIYTLTPVDPARLYLSQKCLGGAAVADGLFILLCLLQLCLLLLLRLLLLLLLPLLSLLCHCRSVPCTVYRFAPALDAFAPVFRRVKTNSQLRPFPPPFPTLWVMVTAVGTRPRVHTHCRTCFNEASRRCTYNNGDAVERVSLREVTSNS